MADGESRCVVAWSESQQQGGRRQDAELAHDPECEPVAELRIAANVLHRYDGALGAFLRRKRAAQMGYRLVQVAGDKQEPQPAQLPSWR